MPRTNTNKRLTLQGIHRALTATMPKMEEDNLPRTNEETQTLQAVRQGTEVSPFHDTLNEYSLVARPATLEDVTELATLVRKMIRLCGTSSDAWKIFTLTTFLRRYHGKAPEARAMALAPEEGCTDESVGDGERLLFYGTLLTLYHFWKGQEDTGEGKCANEALKAMIRVASRIGGTRDLCAIIEHLTMACLVESGFVAVNDPPDSFADKLVPAVHQLALGNPIDASLEMALHLAADQVDQDLQLLQCEADDDSEALLSTIHVMLPHNQRGSNTKGSWQRKLANSLAEVLIWEKTSLAKTDSRFANALAKLKTLPSTSIDQGHALIQQLQTTARKQRQRLNAHARRQGFLLTSSYQMDKTSVTLRLIRRAKAGDLRMLQRLASKNKDARVLGLLAKRHLDPSKATAMSSIQELVNGWLDVTKDYGDDEVAKLELALQANTVEATIAKLRCTSVRPALVTCEGGDRDNLVCSVLVAASLDESQLLLGGELCAVSSTEKCVELLNQVLMGTKFMNDDNSWSVLMSFLSSAFISSGQDLIVLSSRDLELDGKDLQDLEDRDITLRVHATKKIEAIGKVSLSLNSTIHDRIKAREPLSLGVMLDCTGSMGSEIEGCKQGALNLISTFRELAPVGSFNFMGYWDPVFVGSDPLPKCTGFLDAKNPKNMTILQDFVNKELKCQGGGDEPEDIPKALEVFLEEMRKAGLSGDKGVHLLFFIADAGFRANENARMQAALNGLKDLGVVFVMCRVRGGASLQTMVDRTKECFAGVGQYIEVNGVGQLESIAASVTESIRASLFQSNVKSITASVGSTIDAVRKLVHFQHDHDVLKKTGNLTNLDDDGDEMETDEAKPEVFAAKKEFSLTSRDRLYLQLSRLPPLCQKSVDVAFGGKTLQQLSAALIADRLCADEIPLGEVQKAGYPADVVALVQDLMGGHGAMQVND